MKGVDEEVIGTLEAGAIAGARPSFKAWPQNRSNVIPAFFLHFPFGITKKSEEQKRSPRHKFSYGKIKLFSTLKF